MINSAQSIINIGIEQVNQTHSHQSVNFTQFQCSNATLPKLENTNE